MLLGALVLHRIENDREFGEMLRDFVKRELPGFLTRESDKALFANLLNGTRAGQTGVVEDAPAMRFAIGERQEQVPQIDSTAAESLGHRFDETV